MTLKLRFIFHVNCDLYVFQALGFDLVTRINLCDLSYLLEQEIMAADEENAIFQAAFASYQQEIIHLK